MTTIIILAIAEIFGMFAIGWLANIVNVQVSGNAPDPRPKLLFITKVSYFDKTFDEGLLRNIFRIMAVAQDSEANGEDSLRLLLHKFGISLPVAQATGCYQFFLWTAVQEKLPIFDFISIDEYKLEKLTDYF